MCRMHHVFGYMPVLIGVSTDHQLFHLYLQCLVLPRFCLFVLMKDNWDVEIYVLWLLEYQRLASVMKDNLSVWMSAGPMVFLRSSGCCSIVCCLSASLCFPFRYLYCLIFFPLKFTRKSKKTKPINYLQELENSQFFFLFCIMFSPLSYVFKLNSRR